MSKIFFKFYVCDLIFKMKVAKGKQCLVVKITSGCNCYQDFIQIELHRQVNRHIIQLYTLFSYSKHAKDENFKSKKKCQFSIS